MNKAQRILGVLVLYLVAAEFLQGQISRGTVEGRVTDPVGAVIPQANVEARENATGAIYTTKSNAEGLFTLPSLAPGTYTITVTASGFKSTIQTNAVVAANEHLSADVVMTVGETSETISVQADSPLLETTVASTGQVLNREDIENMPVNGRTPLILGQLAYGAISTGNPQFNHPYDNSGPSSVALGGGASKKNELLMDGTPDGGADGTIAFSPPMDAVEEVKVETFQADAAYGHTSGGTVNQVTKSGTNQIHGTAYEFLQNSYLNDTPWFSKHTTPQQPKPVTHFNQFGGTIGLPIVIPHLYDGHNKLFLFFAFEGITQNQPNPTYVTVPTAAEKNGDFSALLPLTTPKNEYRIFDPASGKVSGSQVSRTVFANNVIPASRLNPVGVKLVNLFPAPNIPGNADGTNNYYFAGDNRDRFDSEMSRIDYMISQKNKIWYGFRHNDRYHTSGNAFNNVATGSTLIQPNWGSTVDDVHTFNSKTVWENRVNWTRNIESRPLASVDPASLGFPQYLANAATVPAIPVTAGTKFTDFGYSKGDYIPFDSFQVFSLMNRTFGKHTTDFGGDWRIYKVSSFRYGNPKGSFNFGLQGGQGWTNGPFNNSAAGVLGQELASMLLGLPTAGSIDVNDRQVSQAKYYAIFFQDNWKLIPNLTLNLGLRYERDLATTEKHNEAVRGFDTGATSPINAAAQANFAASPVSGVTFPKLVGGLVYADDNRRNFYTTPSTGFSPRLGFAYTPMKDMSVRGGFGIFFDSVGRVDPIATGFNQTTQMLVTSNGYLSPSATLSDPFPGGSILQPPGSSLGLASNLGQTISFPRSQVLPSYNERWNLDVQKQFGSTLIEFGYVGSHAVHLGVSRNIDFIPASYLNVGQARDSNVISFLQANVSNPFRGLLPGTTLNGNTVQRQQLLLPYPHFTGVTQASEPAGSAIFHEFEARVEKRLSHGVRYLVNYSWSKRLERVSYLNPQDIMPEKRISSDDRPQHLVVSTTWELPFGEKRAYRVPVPVVNYAISGWNVSGIYTYQPQGAPLTWSDIIYSGTGGLNDLKVSPHNVNAAFDVNQFNRTSSAQPVTGTHIRTLPTQVAHARQDGINAFDMSLIKSNRITERLSAQLRADAFNALNHPNFSGPNLTPTSSAFGTITSQANLPRTIQVALRLVF
ncbi:TonB-dependent receptor [Terriglobus albidus]|uniref:TonB-dependent receptor n=1 Tax=Terriglobus albidus TaxID=1592106 RepID=A0A5B9EC36_9BACT|nr:TonB-dependent receptor [Terriglobus albidus]QEE29204.1 TonB-dependent receptor [Terriglobus albidus]